MCNHPEESDDDDIIKTNDIQENDDDFKKANDMQEDPTGQKYGRLEEEGGMGPDKVQDSQLI